MKLFIKILAACAISGSAFAADQATDLDLTIQYYSKVLSNEGVTREASYQESMLRRPGHVWFSRILPANLSHAHHDAKSASGKNSGKKNTAEHQHFNPVMIPRHITLDKERPSIEFIDQHEKLVVAIPQTEFDNVNFDGSWENNFYLVDPKIIKSMTASKQVSAIAGAKWFEREKNGIFQKVLWDEQKQIPLMVESGDKAGTFYKKITITLSNTLQTKLPWTNLKGYTRKEYSDFLD